MFWAPWLVIPVIAGNGCLEIAHDIYYLGVVLLVGFLRIGLPCLFVWHGGLAYKKADALAVEKSIVFGTVVVRGHEVMGVRLGWRFPFR